MGFLIYDIGFLVLFSVFVFVFLYIKRKNLSREGAMYLYRTKLGMKFIDYIGRVFEKQIRAMRYLVITLGYLLLAGILYVLGKSVYIYIKVPEITQVIKTPPLVPLIPYFPSIFGVESFFPPFYFTYFLIALIVVAFSHEFAHGIFAKANKVRIKSTGVVFLGPILGAFVEQNDKDMNKKGKTAQMSILGAGVFANVIVAIVFFLLLLLVFGTMFAPAGAKFSTYSYGVVNVSSIISVTAQTNGLYLIETNTAQDYVLDMKNIFIQLGNNLDYSNPAIGNKQIVAFYDAPAVNKNLSGAITEINGNKINNLNDFVSEMQKYRPGDKINILTTTNTEGVEIVLGEHPLDKTKPFLGVGFENVQGGLTGLRKIYSSIFFFKDPSTYYKEKYALSGFLYNLIWWIALINFMVALFNMLPFGFLDGGKFFYLTIWGITGSKKAGERGFKYASILVLLLFVLLILSWLFAFV